jgi:hypothetical protein
MFSDCFLCIVIGSLRMAIGIDSKFLIPTLFIKFLCIVIGEHFFERLDKIYKPSIMLPSTLYTLSFAKFSSHPNFEIIIHV